MKNLNELSTSHDSLQEFLETKKISFTKGMNRSKYYKYTRKINNYSDTAQILRDSIIRRIKPEDLVVISNLDSLYKTLDPGTKQRVMEIALDYAVTSKKLVSSTQKDLYERKKNIQKHRNAWHEKFTLSFACLIFFFIGAPLGAIIRKGGFGLPFLVSIVFFIAYYIVFISGKKLATEGDWASWQGMWLASFFTLPLGVFLTYKATTDSVIFDFNTYIDFIKRPFKVYEIKYKDPDLVFYKDIEKMDATDLEQKMTQLLEQSSILLKQLKIVTSSHNKVYTFLLSKEFPNFQEYVLSYDSLFDNIAVQYRHIKYIKTNLEKFPEIKIIKYLPTEKKRYANYILLTILYFPVGLLFLFRSYLKLNVLRKKIELVNTGITTIADQIVQEN